MGARSYRTMTEHFGPRSKKGRGMARRSLDLIEAMYASAEAAQPIANLVRNHKIDVLNVAGPRQSEWPEGYDYAFRALETFLARCSHRPMGGRKRD